MSDKPIDLAAERRKRATKADQEAHEHGQAFKLLPYQWDEYHIGIIEGVLPIVLLTNIEDLEGIAMTRSDAKSLGEALLSVAEMMPVIEEP